MYAYYARLCIIYMEGILGEPVLGAWERGFFPGDIRACGRHLPGGRPRGRAEEQHAECGGQGCIL